MVIAIATIALWYKLEMIILQRTSDFFFSMHVRFNYRVSLFFVVFWVPSKQFCPLTIYA